MKKVKCSSCEESVKMDLNLKGLKHCPNCGHKISEKKRVPKTKFYEKRGR